MEAVEAHEQELFSDLESRLTKIDGVTLYGQCRRSHAHRALSIEGVENADASAQLAAFGVNAPEGNFYALEASRSPWPWRRRRGTGWTGAVYEPERRRPARRGRGSDREESGVTVSAGGPLIFAVWRYQPLLRPPTADPKCSPFMTLRLGEPKRGEVLVEVRAAGRIRSTSSSTAAALRQ